MRKFILVLTVLWISSFIGSAQSFLYELEDSLSADDLVMVIRGAGIDTFFNAQVGHCGPRQRGRFDAHGQPNDLGMNAGIILTNFCVETDSSLMLSPEQPSLRGLGFPKYATGDYPTGAGWELQDDPDETGIPEFDTSIIAIYESLPAPNHADWGGGNCKTRYRCGLNFDFIPTGDTISFLYVFASDNYPYEAVCQVAHEGFFALLSGPGIEGKKNIAVVPGTEVLVSTNTINDFSLYEDVGGGILEYCNSIHEDAPFSEYYIDNWVLLSDHVPYSGFTTVLEARCPVNPCDTYHIELTVNGNSGDVNGFIEAGSFKSNGEVQKCGDTASSVSRSTEKVPFCTAYPSPFNSTLQIKLQRNTSVSSLYDVSIADITGRAYFNEEGSLLSINQNLVDIGSRLSPGVYFLRVEDRSSGRIQMLKVVRS